MNEFLKDAILYEIYPTSFYDGNGDGVGDFIGITQKLDYVKSLGVNLIWVNPFYLSPFMDGGYDVSDFKQIDPRFGTMEDFDNFIIRCNELGLKVITDMVIGHTSVEHEWFKQSAKAERNKYSDFYIWTDSVFTKHKDNTVLGLHARDGGYIINYYASQPALNYGWQEMEKCSLDGTCIPNSECEWKIHYKDERVKPVRDEIIEIMLFWLRKGVFGFRVDMAGSLVKRNTYDFETVDDNLLSGNIWIWKQLMAGVKKEFPDCLFLAEWVNPMASVGKAGFDLDYIAHDVPEYNALFRNENNTNLSRYMEKGDNYFSANGKGSIKPFLEYANKVYSSIDNKGFFSAPTGCHDEVRMATGVNDIEVMKVAFAFLLTFKIVPFIYYGDEIGLKHNFDVRKDGGGVRTGARTPMQWNNEKNRGFSVCDTVYLPTNDDKGICVEEQEKDNDSLLNTVKKLIEIRKTYACLNADTKIDYLETDYPLIYRRSDNNSSIVVMINPSNNAYNRKVDYKKIIFCKNIEIKENEIRLKAKSFCIFLEK